MGASAKRAALLVLAGLLLAALSLPTSLRAQDKSPPTVESLIGELGSKFSKQREQAAVELGKRGPAATAAVGALRKALSDSYRPLNKAAAIALSRIDLAEKSGIPVLIKATEFGDDPEVAEALVRYGTETPGVIGAVMRGRASARLPAHRKALEAILAAMGEAILPTVLEWARKPEPDDVRCALELAISLGAAGGPAILAVLDNPSPVLRDIAVKALSVGLRDAYPAPIPWCLSALQDGKTPADKVAEAEAKLIAAGAASLPGLSGLLLDSDVPLARVRAAGVLERLGPAALPAAPALRTAAGEFTAEVREAARSALAAVDPANRDAPPPPWRILHPFLSIRTDRRSDRGKATKVGLIPTPPGVTEALAWLERHQSPDGLWRSARFEERCAKEKCGGAGSDGFDVGVTGLAVLAFLAEGETPTSEKYGPTVRRGIEALLAAQDADGCVGRRGWTELGPWIFNHAIAGLALVEASAMTGSRDLRRRAQAAVEFTGKCQNPYSGWRYGLQPKDNDTCVTGWMVFQLRVAKEAGFDVEPLCLDGARAWLDKATEPEFGRVGYRMREEPGPRYVGSGGPERFPPLKSEGTTAIGILGRIFAGADADDEYVAKGVALLVKKEMLPVWDEKAGGIDFHSWNFTALVLAQSGGKDWPTWQSAVNEALLEGQCVNPKDERRGSWDVVDPWSATGGRVYATAMNCLTLQTAYRYARLR